MASQPEKSLPLHQRALRPVSVVPVDQRAWDRLSEKCNRLPLPSVGRATWLSVFAGGLLSSLSLAAAVLLDDAPPLPGLLWLVIAILGAVSAVGLIANWLGLRDEVTRTRTSRQDVLDEIQFIEESWAPTDDEASAVEHIAYAPLSGSLEPPAATLKQNVPTQIEFTGGHTAGFDSIRWVRIFFGPSPKWNRNWSSQVYLSITPGGRLNLWDSEGKSHAAQLPNSGTLETDTATIFLDSAELTCEGQVLSLKLSIAFKISGPLQAYLTTSSQVDLANSGIVKVGEFVIE